MSTDAIKNFDELKNFLKNEGIIQEKDCECEKRTNKKDPCSKKIEVKSKYSDRVIIVLVIQNIILLNFLLVGKKSRCSED